MRRMLDALYDAAGACSAAMVAAIAVLVSAQVVCNLTTRLAGVVGLDINLSIPSYSDVAAFLLAGASFLGLAYTLMRGGHIRVTLLLRVLTGRTSLALELASLIVATLVAAFATFHFAGLLHDSWRFNDLSTGIIAFPLWIPQSVVLAGLGLLTVALADLTIATLRAGHPVLVETVSE